MFDIQAIITSAKKNITKKDIVICLSLIILFFLTRLINLDKWPIFSDEGIYIRWAKIASNDAAWRFISLTDGKQPLQTWGTIPFLKLFPANALLAGRLFSVSTGFVAMIGIFTLLAYLFNKKTAFIGMLFYIFTPYFLFYDRLALVDSGVNAGFIWILIFSIWLAKARRLDVAILLGFISGIALLGKSSVKLFVGLAAFAPIFFVNKNIQKFLDHIINYGVLYAIAGSMAVIIYNLQRLSPFFHYIAEKNTTFVMTSSEFIHDPFKVFFNNVLTIPTFVFWELGVLVALISFVGIFQLFKKDWRLSAYLLIWILIPYLGVALFSKILFGRYLIFFGTLFFIFAIYFIGQLKNKKVFGGILAATLISQIWFSYPILFNPLALNFPPTDKGQYVTGQTAVWGAQDLMAFAREKSKEKPVLLLVEGNFGLAADVLDVFIKPTDQITIKGVWPLDEKQLLETRAELKDKYVYIVFSHREKFPESWPITLIKKYSKPSGDKALYLFKYNEE